MPGESPQDIARFCRSLQVPKGSGPPDYSWHQLVVRAATKVIDRYFPFCKNAIRSRKSAGVRPASTPSGINDVPVERILEMSFREIVVRNSFACRSVTDCPFS